MIGRLIDNMRLFYPFMTITVMANLILAALYMGSLRWFHWGAGRIRLFGFFWGLSRRNMVMFSCSWMRMWYILVTMMMLTDIGPSQVGFVVGIGICLVVVSILGKSISGVFSEIMNTTTVVVGLLCGNLLVSYMRDIRFEWNILAVYGLLTIFMLIYCMYFLMRDIKRVSRERQIKDAKVEDEDKNDME